MAASRFLCLPSSKLRIGGLCTSACRDTQTAHHEPAYPGAVLFGGSARTIKKARRRRLISMPALLARHRGQRPTASPGRPIKVAAITVGPGSIPSHNSPSFANLAGGIALGGHKRPLPANRLAETYVVTSSPGGLDCRGVFPPTASGCPNARSHWPMARQGLVACVAVDALLDWGTPIRSAQCPAKRSRLAKQGAVAKAHQKWQAKAIPAAPASHRGDSPGLRSRRSAPAVVAATSLQVLGSLSRNRRGGWVAVCALSVRDTQNSPHLPHLLLDCRSRHCPAPGGSRQCGGHKATLHRPPDSAGGKNSCPCAASPRLPTRAGATFAVRLIASRGGPGFKRVVRLGERKRYFHIQAPTPVPAGFCKLSFWTGKGVHRDLLAA